MVGVGDIFILGFWVLAFCPRSYSLFCHLRLLPRSIKGTQPYHKRGNLPHRFNLHGFVIFQAHGMLASPGESLH